MVSEEPNIVELIFVTSPTRNETRHGRLHPTQGKYS